VHVRARTRALHRASRHNPPAARTGGQKHRVALARACYADADVYLLDDPLSAVDAHVGLHLMTRCVLGLLGGKTRVLVTHQLQYLPEADLVVKMDAGRIAHVGTHAELLQQGVTFAEYSLHKHGCEAGDDEGGVDSGAIRAERSVQSDLAAGDEGSTRASLDIEARHGRRSSDARASLDALHSSGVSTSQSGRDSSARCAAQRTAQVGKAEESTGLLQAEVRVRAAVLSIWFFVLCIGYVYRTAVALWNDRGSWPMCRSAQGT
jgi:ABC-type sulfate/molybdate transport systems ATPase subunit